MNLQDAGKLMSRTARFAANRTCCASITIPRRRNSLLQPRWSELDCILSESSAVVLRDLKNVHAEAAKKPRGERRASLRFILVRIRAIVSCANERERRRKGNADGNQLLRRWADGGAQHGHNAVRIGWFSRDAHARSG